MPDTAVSSSVKTPDRHEAFETFYQREREEVLRTVLFVLEEDVAVAAFDQAMARAFDRWDDVAELENQNGWVIRVALDVAGRRRRGQPEPAETDPDAVADAPIADALARLDVQQRAVLVLRFHLDWSVDQIGKALEEPVGTIKSRLQRGLGRLRTLLTEAGLTPDLEERLRSHFADRRDRLRLPTPAVNDELARIVEGAHRRRRPNVTAGRGVRLLGLAVVVAVVGVLVAVLVPEGDSGGDRTASQSPRPSTSDQEIIPPSTPTPPPTDAGLTPAPVAAQPIVVGPFGELGWWNGSAWVNSQPGVPIPVQGGEAYQMIGLDQPPTTRTGAFSTELCTTDPARQGVQAVDAGYGPREGWPALLPVAVSGVAEPRPRPVAVLDPGAEAYRTAAADVLASLGVPDADPQIVQVLRSDLDADGFDDVLVVVEQIANWESLMGRQGDYSVVFVRRVVDDVVHTAVAAQSFPYGVADGAGLRAIDSLRISAIADLNGDGRMEAVLQNDHSGGRATAVYEMQADGSLLPVIGRACDG